MKMEFIVEVDSKMYEISELIKSVSYTDKLNDGCSKLDFSFKGNDLNIQNGSAVRFKYNGSNIFYGYVFKYDTNKNMETSVTAYDQLRYAKAKDTIVCRNDTITSLVKRMCNYFNLKSGILTDTNYKLATSIHDDKTWLDILYSAISETLTNNSNWYALRDEFGSLCLRNIEDLQLNLILGDESLCYDYAYEKSIDEDFYNQIKIYVKGEDNSTVGSFITVKDESSIKKYGLLQYFETMENKNASQAKSKADMLLKLYNREVTTLSLECLGNANIRAGNSFYGQIGDIDLNKRLIVRTVTHKFLPVHTMSLEVAI